MNRLWRISGTVWIKWIVWEPSRWFCAGGVHFECGLEQHDRKRRWQKHADRTAPADGSKLLQDGNRTVICYQMQILFSDYFLAIAFWWLFSVDYVPVILKFVWFRMPSDAFRCFRWWWIAWRTRNQIKINFWICLKFTSHSLRNLNVSELIIMSPSKVLSIDWLKSTKGSK